MPSSPQDFYPLKIDFMSSQTLFHQVFVEKMMLLNGENGEENVLGKMGLTTNLVIENYQVVDN